jgi:hypothetical protein
MAFHAPVSYQAGGLGLDPTTGQQIQGPRRPFDWEAWLQSPGTVERPTDAEYGEMSRTIAEQQFAEVVNMIRSSSQRFRDLERQRGNAVPGLETERIATEMAVLDNNLKTFHEVQAKLQKQIQSTGGVDQNLVPLLADGRPTGLFINPNNPDGAPVRTGVSPDQEEQTRRQQENSRNTAANIAAQGDTQRDVAQQGVVRQQIQADAAKAVAQLNADRARTVADARLLEIEAKSADTTLEQGVKIMDQITTLKDTHAKNTGEVAKQLVADSNANEREWLSQFVEHAGLAQEDLASFRTAISAFNSEQGAQDRQAFASQMERGTKREDRAMQVAAKLYEDYAKDLQKVYSLPEGWFQAFQRAAQSQAYRHELPALRAMMQHPNADPAKLKEFYEQTMGLFGPMPEPNWRPLREPERPAPPAPLPTTLRDQQTENQTNLAAALRGELFPQPDTAHLPGQEGFTPLDPRAAITGATPGTFSAPTSGGQPPLSDPSWQGLKDFMQEPDPYADLYEDQVTPDLTPIPEPELGPMLDPNPNPMADYDLEADMRHYQPVLDAAPDEFVPLAINVIAGLAARDDVALDPERVLREEIDYAFGPFGLTYDLASPWDEEEEDTFDYTLDDYGGDLYAV